MIYWKGDFYPMKKLYAAYGSNLNLRQMACRCPDATVVGTAELEDYELIFRGGPGYGVATVEPREGSSVPIVLWEISERDEKNLDRYEGWPTFYGKQTLGFEAEGQTIPAMIYVMQPGDDPAFPSKSYYATILEGYEDNGLDPEFLERALERTQELAQEEQGRVWDMGGPNFG